MNKKILILIVAGLLSFLWWRASGPQFSQEKLAQAMTLMQGLESRVMPIALTEDQLTLLEQVYHDSSARIPRINSFRDDDKKNLVVLLSSHGFSGDNGEYHLNTIGEKILSLSLGRTDEFHTYLDSGFENDMSAVTTKDQIKKLAQSINTLTNDIRLSTLYITWYEGVREKICTTNDPNNDISLAGEVKMVYKANISFPDVCTNNELKQYRCINSMYENDTAHSITTTCANGCSNGACLNASEDTFKSFNISLPSSATINTPIDVEIFAVKNDNSTDTNYNKSILILIEGDPTAIVPLTPQTLSNGSINLPKSITFKSTGEKTVTVKDINTGVESKKTITITAENEGNNTENEGDNQNDENTYTPLGMALLDNTTGLVYGKDTYFMKLDIIANKSDILLKTLPLNINIYTKKLTISNLKLRDSKEKIIDVTMTMVNKINEFDKDVQVEIKFNTPYALPAGSSESFILTGTLSGSGDPYDTIITGLGDKNKFTGTDTTKQKSFTGEDISGYSWNAIWLRRK